MATINFYSKEQIDTLLDGKADTGDIPTVPNVVQSTGQSTTDIMSQKAVTDALGGKQASLNTAQMNAVNSGITSAKVNTYDAYANNKINALPSAPSASHALISKQGDANDIQESTVTSTELGYLSGVTSSVQTQINGKQNTISIVLTDNTYYTMTY